MLNTFIVDLDGTLLQENGELNHSVQDYLVQLQECGYRLIIATGRKQIEAANIINQLKLEKYGNAAILSDGQFLLDFADKTTNVEPFLEFPDDYITIIDSLEDQNVIARLITADHDYEVYKSIFSMKLWRRFVKCVLKMKNPFSGVVVGYRKKVERIEKITFQSTQLKAKQSADICASYSVSFVNDKQRFEFKHKSVNKCETVKKYIAKHNIPMDSIAVFGNDENDLCLFNYFTNSFVVDTAAENVKIRAHTIIRYDNGAGVAEKIKEIVEEQKKR